MALKLSGNHFLTKAADKKHVKPEAEEAETKTQDESRDEQNGMVSSDVTGDCKRDNETKEGEDNYIFSQLFNCWGFNDADVNDDANADKQDLCDVQHAQEGDLKATESNLARSHKAARKAAKKAAQEEAKQARKQEQMKAAQERKKVAAARKQAQVAAAQARKAAKAEAKAQRKAKMLAEKEAMRKAVVLLHDEPPVKTADPPKLDPISIIRSHDNIDDSPFDPKLEDIRRMSFTQYDKLLNDLLEQLKAEQARLYEIEKTRDEVEEKILATKEKIRATAPDDILDVVVQPEFRDLRDVLSLDYSASDMSSFSHGEEESIFVGGCGSLLDTLDEMDEYDRRLFLQIG